MRFLISILLFSFSFSTILHVPADYDSIQVAIDEAFEGDTVLVAPGTYYENLVIQKNITLASHAIFDNLDNWVEFGEIWELTEDAHNISGTIIDGSHDTNGSGFESVILIDSPGGECIEPLIFGFTITGGNGTTVSVEIDSREGEREILQQVRGGGFLSINALPRFKYNAIIENKGNTAPIHDGGGGDQTSGVDIPTHPDYNWGETRTECTGVLDLSTNLFRDNKALYGSTFSTLDFLGSVDMTNSIFDVYEDNAQDISEYWINTESPYDASNSDGTENAIVEDVWVSPSGDDSNSGLTSDDAFLTINRALEIIYPTDDNPITIHLLEGTYAPSTTGEVYSIIMISNITLIGEGPDVTILNAEQTGRVITMNDVYNVTISRLTLTGGYAQGDHHTTGLGGGLYARRSVANVNRVAIVNNKAWSQGKGFYAKMAELDMYNVTISNNEASEVGNCPYCWYYSSMKIVNTIIWDNDLFDFEEEFVFLDFYYSNIQGEYEGEENMNIDPLFVDPANGNYTLQGNSPCIDSGTLDNIPYYCGDAPDIGAFEFISEECVDECDGYIMDQCGICDGDGLSCLDCCDVINGDNSTCGGNGNVNGGGLNVTDIVAIVELILEIELFDECQNNDADVNLDGSLNIMDVLVLVEWILNDSAPFVFDIDGNVYNIIEIGNQSWMKENLKVTHYRNGDGIPTNHTAIEWVELTSGAYSFYNNDPVNIIIFGNIYNYYAVDDERGLCPEGWHVPSDDEWTSLAMYLDPSASPDAVGYQSEIAGGMLKETGTIEDGDGYWHDPNEGATNETGFSARAGGARNGTSTGHYLYMGTSNYYWTSTEYSSNDIWYRRLNKYSAGILRVHWDGGSGYSVRCIQD